MLVLSRRLGETIVIAGDVTVTVVDISGGKVRLGISAPKEVHVDREEVFRRRNEFMAPAELAPIVASRLPR